MADGPAGIHVEAVGAGIPDEDRDPRPGDDLDATEPLPQEDAEAETERELEAAAAGIPESAQPESQGEDPLDAALGPDGQGDLAPEDR